MPEIDQLICQVNKDHSKHYKEYNSVFMKAIGKFTLIPKNQNLRMTKIKQTKKHYQVMGVGARVNVIKFLV